MGIVRRSNYNSGTFHFFLSPFGVPWWKTLNFLWIQYITWLKGSLLWWKKGGCPVLQTLPPLLQTLLQSPEAPQGSAWKSVKLSFRSSPPGLTSWYSVSSTCDPCWFQGQNYDTAFSLRKEKRGALIRKIMVRFVKSSTEFLVSPQELCSLL